MSKSPIINTEPLGAVPPNENLLLNGDLSVWQRATSFNVANAEMTADRWPLNIAGTVVRQTDVPSGMGFVYSAQVNVPIGPTQLYNTFVLPTTGEAGVLQLGRTVTYSFWLKSQTIGLDVSCIGRFGDESLSAANGPGNEWSEVVGVTDGTWQQFFITHTMTTAPTATNKIFRVGCWTVDNDTFNVTGMKLEFGNAVTEFAFVEPATVLLACQAYFWRGVPLIA
jgi:hypothetical protein